MFARFNLIVFAMRYKSLRCQTLKRTNGAINIDIIYLKYNSCADISQVDLRAMQYLQKRAIFFS